jgi:hypothetical protein
MDMGEQIGDNRHLYMDMVVLIEANRHPTITAIWGYKHLIMAKK